MRDYVEGFIESMSEEILIPVGYQDNGTLIRDIAIALSDDHSMILEEFEFERIA